MLGPTEIVLIVFAGVTGLAIVVGLPVFLGIRYARYEREMVHAERMKALELGRHLPGESPWTPAKSGMWIAASGPLGVVVTTGIAVGSGINDDGPWIASGLVGIAAVLGGTLLALRSPSAPHASDADLTADHGKPALDPDAYDVVSRRG
jgi:hypothetical protein